MQKGRKQPKYDYRANLTESQNFITDKKLIKRIISIGKINKEDTVIEIGTGKGHLTEELCLRGSFVYSIELDSKLYEKQKQSLADLQI